MKLGLDAVVDTDWFGFGLELSHRTLNRRVKGCIWPHLTCQTRVSSICVYTQTYTLYVLLGKRKTPKQATT